MRIALSLSLLIGVVLMTSACREKATSSAPAPDLYVLTRSLAVDHISRDEAILITERMFRELYGEPRHRLRVLQAELDDMKVWTVELFWDNGWVGGGIKTRIDQGGWILGVEYLMGE